MRSYLQFHWWKYLLVILLPVIVWCSVFDAAAKPAPNEQVNVLLIGESFDTAAMEEAIATALPSLTEQALRRFSVSTMVIGDTGYASLLTARCFDYDILIFEESSIPENLGQDVFVRLTDPLLAQFPGLSPYTETIPEGDELVYGLWIPDNARFSGFYTGSARCCLFVSPYSVNFDTLNETGTAGQDGALKCAQYLLECEP